MPSAEIPILYQDEHLLAVDKPAGILVHRNVHARQEPALVQLVRDQTGSHVYPVHRLDRPTSGLMLLARTSWAAAELAKQFALRQVQKTYLAVVRGFTAEHGVIDAPLPNGADLQPAITTFRRLETTEIAAAVGPYTTARYSLVAASPATGRTHQIRRHFAHIRHPVIGDVLRGDGKHNRFFRDQFALRRLLLASVTLTFTHPQTKKTMHLVCPPGQELANLFTHLGWSAWRRDSECEPNRTWRTP